MMNRILSSLSFGKLVTQSEPPKIPDKEKELQSAIVQKPEETKIKQTSLAKITNELANKQLAVSNSGSHVDALWLRQGKLEKLIESFNTEIKRWEKSKIDMLGVGFVWSNDSQAATQGYSFLQKIKDIIKDVKEACEFPDQYLSELFARTKPHIDELSKKLHALIKSADAVVDTDYKKKAEICDLAIQILNGLEAMINNVQGEIVYCLDFENMSEKIRDKLVEYIVGEKIFVNIHLDSNTEMKRYRFHLYDKIHPHMEKIEKLVTDTQGLLKSARLYLNENQFINDATIKKNTNRFFYTPEQNVRDAIDKIDHLEKTPTKISRTVSYSSFASF